MAKRLGEETPGFPQRVEAPGMGTVVSSRRLHRAELSLSQRLCGSPKHRATPQECCHSWPSPVLGKLVLGILGSWRQGRGFLALSLGFFWGWGH